MVAQGDLGRTLTPGRWREIELLFGEALEQAPEVRAEWVAAATPDLAIRDQVLSLLSAHDAESGPLDRPCPPPPPAPDTPLVPGDRLGPYEIVGPLGAGGMAYVFRAHDSRLGRDVALKLVAPRLASHPPSLRRFEREARAVAALSHPNIVALHDVGREGNHDFTVMELLQGESLRERLARGPMVIPEALRLGRDVARGLGAAHERGLVHRDLKPDNVFLTASGPAKVLDFGIARLSVEPAAPGDALSETPPGARDFDPASDTASGILGTAGYLSPEQARGWPADARSDVFSYGCVLYECLTGRRAFEGTNLRGAIDSALLEEPAPVRRLRPDVPRSLAAIVDRCLKKDAAERFPSGKELAAALEPLAAEAEAAAHRRRDWRLPVAAFGLALAAAASFWGWRLWRARDFEPASPDGVLIRESARDGALRYPPASPRSTRTRPSVALSSFTCADGCPDEAWVGWALVEVVAADLRAGEEIRIIPSYQEAGSRPLAGDYSLMGSYSRQPSTSAFRVAARVIHTASGRELGRWSIEDPSPSALGHRLSEGVREALGLGPLPGPAAASVRGILPASPDGLRGYAIGLRRLRSFDPAGARQVLEEAARLEPQNAMILSLLGESLRSLGHERKAAEIAERAFSMAAGASTEQRLLLEGQLHASKREWGPAVAAYQALFSMFPDDLEHGLRLADAQILAGSRSDALKTLGRLRALPSPMADDPRIDVVEAFAAADLDNERRAQTAARAVREARSVQQPALLARALYLEAQSMRGLGRPDMARRGFEEALEIYRSLGDRYRVAMTLFNIGVLAENAGRLQEARLQYESRLAVSREMGHRWSVSGALRDLGRIGLEQGDTAGADRFLKESLTVGRELEDEWEVAATEGVLAQLAHMRCDLPEAKRLYESAVERSRRTNRTRVLAGLLCGQSHLALDAGDVPGATRLAKESVALFTSMHEKSDVIAAETALAEAHEAQGRFAEAAHAARESARAAKDGGRALLAARALVVLGRAELAAGTLPEAEAAARSATAIAQQSESLGARADATTLRALVIARSGRPQEALALLEPLASDAKVAAIPLFHIRVDLARGQLQIAAGDRSAARVRLRAVSEQARTVGFLRIAAQARSLLAESEASRSPR